MSYPSLHETTNGNVLGFQPTLSSNSFTAFRIKSPPSTSFCGRLWNNWWTGLASATASAARARCRPAGTNWRRLATRRGRCAPATKRRRGWPRRSAKIPATCARWRWAQVTLRYRCLPCFALVLCKNSFFPSTQQLEEYIPFRFSRFITVKKKNEWRGLVYFRPCKIPFEIDHAPKITHSYLLRANW